MDHRYEEDWTGSSNSYNLNIAQKRTHPEILKQLR